VTQYANLTRFKKEPGIRKDRALDALAQHANVAQFVSFAPEADGDLSQQFCRIAGFAPNHMFPSLTAAIRYLFSASSDGTINIRSYSPDSPRSREFVYGIASTEEAVRVARRLAGAGLFIIANETIDVADGGVSGVAQGGVVEFAPNDTPRCVEKPGVASLPNKMAISLLSKVYGFTPEIGDTHTRDLNSAFIQSRAAGRQRTPSFGNTRLRPGFRQTPV
jgi:hypothetical protein